MLIDNIPSDLLKIIVNYVGDEDLISFIMNHSKFSLYEINMFLDVLKKYIGKQNKCNKCRKNYYEFEYKKCRKSFKKAYICDICLDMFFYYDPICDQYLNKKKLKLLKQNLYKNKDILDRLIKPINPINPV